MDIMVDLAERFWVVEYDLLEHWDHVGFPPDGKTIPEWSEEQDRATKLLRACRESIDPLPQELLQEMQNFLEKYPVQFERAAMLLTEAIGFHFLPTDATAFCEALRGKLQDVLASQAQCRY